MLVAFRKAHDIEIVALKILSEEFVFRGIGLGRISAVIQESYAQNAVRFTVTDVIAPEG